MHAESVYDWIPGENCHYEKVPEMHALVGYWLYAEADDTDIKIRGTAVADPAFDLKEGWNLVGPLAAASPASLGIDCVFGWLPLRLIYHALGLDEDLAPGAGYWIWADTARAVPLARWRNTLVDLGTGSRGGACLAGRVCPPLPRPSGPLRPFGHSDAP